MLKFETNQMAYVNQVRHAFNVNQAAMATQFDMDSDGMALIGNASPLPRDAWGEWDREGIMLQRSTIGVFNDLASSVSMPMDIGVLVHHFQTVSGSGEANISLDGINKGKTDQQVVDYHGTPLPITTSPFSYGWRQVLAARRAGVALDGAGRLNAHEIVTRSAETSTLAGNSIKVGDAQSYGLRTHPSRNTRTTGVTLITATGAEWVAEITATLKAQHAANYKVPATIYVNFDDWFYASSTDFKANGDKTIAQRVQEIPGVKEVIATDSVLANEIFAVVKDRRVVQILNGMPLVSVPQFRANPQDDYDFVTMQAASLEIKFDADGNCGVTHSAPA